MMTNNEDKNDISSEEILDFIHSNKPNYSSSQEKISDPKKNIVSLNKDQQEILNLIPKSSKLDSDVRYSINVEPNRIFRTSTSKPLEDVVITDAEKDFFLRSILLGQPFMLVMELGNKSIVIEVQTISELDKEFLDYTFIKHKLPNDQMKKLYLAFMLKKFQHEDVNLVTDETKKDFEKILFNVNEFFKDKNSITIEFLYNALDLFESKVFKLLKNFDNEGFWKPQD